MRGVVIPVGEVPLRPTINIITNLLHATKVAKLKGEIIMPNYCSNTLTIECPDHIFEQIKNLVQGEHSVFDFDKIVPMPDHIFRGNLGDKERELYGENNWYDWSYENWGTKWNAMDAVLTEDEYVFVTAWSPCSPVIATLAKLFPDAIIHYEYQESGAGFCGVEEYENGMLVYQLDGEYCEYYHEEDDDPEPEYLIPEDILKCPDVHRRNEKYIPENQKGPVKTGKLYLHDHCDSHFGYEIVADICYVGEQPSNWW